MCLAPTPGMATRGAWHPRSEAPPRSAWHPLREAPGTHSAKRLAPTPHVIRISQLPCSFRWMQPVAAGRDLTPPTPLSLAGEGGAESLFRLYFSVMQRDRPAASNRGWPEPSLPVAMRRGDPHHVGTRAGGAACGPGSRPSTASCCVSLRCGSSSSATRATPKATSCAAWARWISSSGPSTCASCCAAASDVSWGDGAHADPALARGAAQDRPVGPATRLQEQPAGRVAPLRACRPGS